MAYYIHRRLSNDDLSFIQQLELEFLVVSVGDFWITVHPQCGVMYEIKRGVLKRLREEVRHGVIRNDLSDPARDRVLIESCSDEVLTAIKLKYFGDVRDVKVV